MLVYIVDKHTNKYIVLLQKIKRCGHDAEFYFITIVC